MAEQAKDHFRNNEAGVEQHADGEGAPKINFVVVRVTHRSKHAVLSSTDNRFSRSATRTFVLVSANFVFPIRPRTERASQCNQHFLSMSNVHSNCQVPSALRRIGMTNCGLIERIVRLSWPRRS